MKLDWDENQQAITIGKAVFSSYRNFKDRKSFVRHVIQKNDLPCTLYMGHPKDANKRCAEALGVSTALLYKYFMALQYKKFVVPVKDVYTKLYYRPGRIKPDALMKVKTSYPILAQAMRDGNTHLLPILCTTCLDPQQLKAMMKSRWKILCKNSLHRNKALAVALRHPYKIEPVGDVVARLEKLLDIPTTLLWNNAGESPDTLRYLRDNFKGQWNKCHKKHTTLFTDTARLAELLGEKADFKWSPRRLKEEHDRMAKEVNARRYSPEKFKNYEKHSVKFLKSGQYVANLLDSAALIAGEGTTMGHCVGLYADSARLGDYLVYSVTVEGQRNSTIGVTVAYDKNDNPNYRLNQHYGKYNATLKDLEERKLGEVVVSMLNKNTKKEVDKVTQYA